jgi:hypothetical protein
MIFRNIIKGNSEAIILPNHFTASATHSVGGMTRIFAGIHLPTVLLHTWYSPSKASQDETPVISHQP